MRSFRSFELRPSVLPQSIEIQSITLQSYFWTLRDQGKARALSNAFQKTVLAEVQERELKLPIDLGIDDEGNEYLEIPPLDPGDVNDIVAAFRNQLVEHLGEDERIDQYMSLIRLTRPIKHLESTRKLSVGEIVVPEGMPRPSVTKVRIEVDGRTDSLGLGRGNTRFDHLTQTP